MSEEGLVSWVGIFGVIWVGDEAPVMVRAESNIAAIVFGVHTHKLLNSRVVHVAAPSKASAAAGIASKVPVVHIEFNVGQVSNSDLAAVPMSGRLIEPPRKERDVDIACRFPG